ncbi:MAG TPA: RNA polymerase sigma factor [Actinomycetota bacterium]|jgi:RNA polymerase sigma factor (sigma-70 family)|nr:RNA polymerase sigma factor [Actinomycetota bacterium]
MAVGEGFPEILRAAQLGAEWAWRTLYRDLAPAVTGYLRLHGVGEPEDLTGEVFVQIVRGLSGFTGDEMQFRSWVFVIAHHRIADERRARTRKPSAPAEFQALEQVAPTGNAEEEALGRLSVGEIRRVLDALSDDQRDIMLLRIVGGLTLEETAGVVGKRIGSVKALQRRAIATIRRMGLVKMSAAPGKLTTELGLNSSAGR